MSITIQTRGEVGGGVAAHLQCSHCGHFSKSHAEQLSHLAAYHPSCLEGVAVGRLGNILMYQSSARLFHCSYCFYTSRDFAKLYTHIITNHCMDKREGRGEEREERGSEGGEEREERGSEGGEEREERGSEGGEERGEERGSEEGEERGSEEGEERGSEGGEERGCEGGERGSERGEEREKRGGEGEERGSEGGEERGCKGGEKGSEGEERGSEGGEERGCEGGEKGSEGEKRGSEEEEREKRESEGEERGCKGGERGNGGEERGNEGEERIIEGEEVNVKGEEEEVKVDPNRKRSSEEEEQSEGLDSVKPKEGEKNIRTIDGGSYRCLICGWRTKQKATSVSHVVRKHEIPKSYGAQAIRWESAALGKPQGGVAEEEEGAGLSEEMLKEEIKATAKVISYISSRYVCLICGWKTKLKGFATSHVVRCHNVECPYLCKECPQKFFLPSQLQHHVRSTHRPGRYACPFCCFRSEFLGGFRRHCSRCSVREEEAGEAAGGGGGGEEEDNEEKREMRGTRKRRSAEMMLIDELKEEED